MSPGRKLFAGRARAALAGVTLWAAVSIGCQRSGDPRAGEAVTELHCVAWSEPLPRMTATRLGALRAEVSELRQRSAPVDVRERDRVVEIARLAASGGDFDLALEALSWLPGDDTEFVSLASFSAAVRLARYVRDDTPEDLLTAGEWLAVKAGSIADQRNRAIVLSALGLAGDPPISGLGADCPWRDRAFGVGEATASESQRESAPLTTDEVAFVQQLISRGEAERARSEIRGRSQAWRLFLERDAVSKWLDSRGDAARRRELQSTYLALAEAYAEATHNPRPARLFRYLWDARESEAGTERPLRLWQIGERLLDMRLPEAAGRALSRARAELATSRNPALSSIELAQAANRFHLGDDRGMLSSAMELRARHSSSDDPWLWARALWLEAVALQGDADWELSLERAEHSRSLYEHLGETASAGYLDVVRGVAMEYLNYPEAASGAYVSAVQRITTSGDERLLSGALWVFARHLGRTGRPHLAVAMLEHALELERRLRRPQHVAETTAALAEQYLAAGRVVDAEAALQEARSLVGSLAGEAPKQRAAAILAQVEAAAAAERPAQAIDALNRHLEIFESFGERYYRTEVLLHRADAWLALEEIERAKSDLRAALDETREQGRRLADRARAVSLFDRAREVVEKMVELLVNRDALPHEVLEWVERSRVEQLVLGIGAAPGAVYANPASLATAPASTCITEYFTLPTELVAWTRCGGGVLHLARQPIEREELRREAQRLLEAGRSGELAAIRGASKRISERLVAPVANLLRESVHWIVIPDGLLPAIPYAWLTLDGRFLFESLDIAVTSSWSALRDRAEGLPPRWKVFAVGDPEPAADDSDERPRLPFARAEAERIAVRFPGSKSWTGSRATWSRIREGQSQANVLHVASHFSSGSQTPLAARILLAPEPGRPSGRVSADEVAREPLAGYVLVVLAGCSSGRAAGGHVSGSLDFARSFLHAGPAFVVSTLWDVPDGALSRSMERYYTFLQAHRSPGRSLRALFESALESVPDPEDLSTVIGLQLTTSALREEPSEEEGR